MGGEQLVTGEIFRDSNGFGSSFCFVGMIDGTTCTGRNEASLYIHSAPINFLASLSLINDTFD